MRYYRHFKYGLYLLLSLTTLWSRYLYSNYKDEQTGRVSDLLQDLRLKNPSFTPMPCAETLAEMCHGTAVHTHGWHARCLLFQQQIKQNTVTHNSLTPQICSKMTSPWTPPIVPTVNSCSKNLPHPAPFSPWLLPKAFAHQTGMLGPYASTHFWIIYV